MPIAQMNWGRMRFALDDERMSDFSLALEKVYSLAESHPGFIWRMPDQQVASELKSLGYDEFISATVSVWTSVETLYDYTFNSLHGDFLAKKSVWFEMVSGPQLVLWDVDAKSRPSFKEAFENLDILQSEGSSPKAYGWPKD